MLQIRSVAKAKGRAHTQVVALEKALGRQSDALLAIVGLDKYRALYREACETVKARIKSYILVDGIATKRTYFVRA